MTGFVGFLKYLKECSTQLILSEFKCINFRKDILQ